MELWDAYTADGTPTGGTLVRGQPIPDGLYHLVCEILVRHADGSYLCMKRAATKRDFPGFYEATAGGAALAGEGPLQCARRELLEETGLSCEGFTPVGVKVSPKNHCIYHAFFCTVDCPKDAVRLQPWETEDYVWMDEEEFIRFIDSDGMIPPRKERFMPWFLEVGYLKKEV